MHRKTANRPSILASAIVMMLLLALTGLLGALAAVVAPTPANASVSSRAADKATCRDYAAYEHHRTARNFRALYRASRHADSYLRIDVADWNGDRNRHASRETLQRDDYFVWVDCNYSADE